MVTQVRRRSPLADGGRRSTRALTNATHPESGRMPRGFAEGGRSAQGRRRSLRVSVLLIVAAGLLVAVDRFWLPLTPLRDAGSTLYGTAESVIGTVTRSVDSGRRAEALEAENARLRADLLASRWKADTSGQLDRLTGASVKHQGVAAHVVGFGRGQQVTIDAGTGAGVTRDVTVLNAGGLVGKITWSGPSTATVTLITDASSSVGARMAGTGELGLVTGMPREGLLRLSLFSPDAPLKTGDQVVTLGSANLRPYVPGVPIGSVIAVERVPGAATRTALVRPSAHLSSLDLVTVVAAPNSR
jgi:rod shape-determining protein MreC